jgi:AAA family ATP:ADP antiporter
MWDRFAKKLPINPGERFITLLMFLYIFGVMGFYYILKPLRSGLFLKTFDARDLPYAYFLTAFLAGIITALIFKLNRRTSTIMVLTGTNIAIIAALFYFSWAMGRDFEYLPYFYYVYVQIVSVLTLSQFWLLAGIVYDQRQSKRIYPLLGAGAISGAMTGSLVPGFLSNRLNPQSMLTLCVGIALFLIILSHAVWRHRRLHAEPLPRRPRFEDSREPFAALFRLVYRSRHLLLIALLIFLTLIATQIADWQVHATAQATYEGLGEEQQEAAINALFGRLYFIVNLIGIVLQLILTGFVIRRFGVGASILFMPAGLFLTSLGVLAAPVLWTTVLSFGSSSVFRHSINRVGLEVLYLPLSPEVRKKVKVFIDVFVDRFGRAFAGVIILAIANLSMIGGLRVTATVIILTSGLSIFLCLLLQKSYVGIFREKLSHYEVDLSEFKRYVTDPRLINLLVQSLDSQQERQILYSLRLLQAVRGFDFSDQLLPLLKHKSEGVREEALRTLFALEGDYTKKALDLVTDGSKSVRYAAIDYYCRHNPEKTKERIDRLLDDKNLDIRISAALWTVDMLDNVYRPSPDIIQSLLSFHEPQMAEAKVAAAGLAALLPAAESVPLLRSLMKDNDPEVVGAAALAAGSSGHKELLDDLLPRLTRANTRGVARQALLRMGPGIIRALADILGDEQHEMNLRREIPWLLGRLETQRSFYSLVDNLDHGDLRLRYQVLKALNRLKDRNPALIRPSSTIADRIIQETKFYCRTFVLLQSLGPGNGTEMKLIRKTLHERMEQEMEIIFRLLGLRHAQQDIHSVYTALKSTRADKRASAIEFLDIILNKNLKPVLLPLLEEKSTERLLEHSSRIFGIYVVSHNKALRQILRQQDTWLKACALYVVGKSAMKDLATDCQRLLGAREPLVREMAEWAWKRCS